MSIFYYFITKKEAPLKIIAQSILMNYPLEDITRYVKDSKSGYIYYLCTPGMITFDKLNKFKQVSEDILYIVN